MNKKEITSDIWEIFRKVYEVQANCTQSDKQVQLLNGIADYVEKKIAENKPITPKKRTKEK